jgi:hypothetical protein
MIECLAIVLSLVEDSGPAQAGLRPFQYKKLEQDLVIVYGNAPFLVVILVVKLAFCPTAALRFFNVIGGHLS